MRLAGQQTTTTFVLNYFEQSIFNFNRFKRANDLKLQMSHFIFEQRSQADDCSIHRTSSITAVCVCSLVSIVIDWLILWIRHHLSIVSILFIQSWNCFWNIISMDLHVTLREVLTHLLCSTLVVLHYSTYLLSIACRLQVPHNRKSLSIFFIMSTRTFNVLEEWIVIYKWCP